MEKGKTYLIASLVHCNYVYWGGFDHSKEKLQVSVDQRAASCGLSNFWDDSIGHVSNPGCLCAVRTGPSNKVCFRSPTLTAYNFAVL